MNKTRSIIEIRNVKKCFDNFHALNGVSYKLSTCEKYVIKGASGSGKSTLLYLLGGLDRPTEGEIIVDGKDLASLSDKELAKYRNLFVGFVFQFHFLLPSMNCLNNILLPSHIAGLSQKNVTDDITELAEVLGVSHCLKKYPYQLSGGEQQRINIIRALSLRPKLLLCDEPTGNLDSENTIKVASLIHDMAEKFNATLILVTHDDNVASRFKNQLLIQDGILYTQ